MPALLKSRVLFGFYWTTLLFTQHTCYACIPRLLGSRKLWISQKCFPVRSKIGRNTSQSPLTSIFAINISSTFGGRSAISERISLMYLHIKNTLATIREKTGGHRKFLNPSFTRRRSECAPRTHSSRTSERISRTVECQSLTKWLIDARRAHLQLLAVSFEVAAAPGRLCR